MEVGKYYTFKFRAAPRVLGVRPDTKAKVVELTENSVKAEIDNGVFAVWPRNLIRETIAVQGGGKRKTRKAHRKGSRKAHRKGNRKSRRSSRK
jgi:hypothetical protein